MIKAQKRSPDLVKIIKAWQKKHPVSRTLKGVNLRRLGLIVVDGELEISNSISKESQARDSKRTSGLSFSKKTKVGDL